MNSVNRLSILACTGIVVAGLAHAGWLAGLWLVAHADSPLHGVWLPLAAQVGLTVVIAAAVGHTLRRRLLATHDALAVLERQAAALEQGRFEVVDAPVAPEVSPLAWRMNALVRRLQQTLAPATASAAGPVEALRRAAPADPETGVDSRFTFLRRLTERLADKAAPETALVVVRHLVTHGAAAADDAAHPPALAKLAGVLREYPQRVAGAFVGRLAENDFALCLPAHGIADDSAASVLAALQSAAGRVRCAAAAVDHLGGLPLSSALALADSALARAEAGGAGCIESRSAREAASPGGDAETRKAIVEALRSGQVQLAEFPVVDAVGGLLHLECPMRLRLGGRFEPATTWLAVASRYRLMTQIDLAGIELALAACAADGTSRCVHVSAESLAAAGFVSAVRSRLEAAQAAAARLCIEISEVSFERLPPRLRNAGTVWRRCGARVGVEHAGAALRSLVRVGELDLDYVKVDPGFVHGIGHDAPQRERARGLVAFVHEMGARVIAEGVDDGDDLQALWELGFDGATGKAATRQYGGADSLSAPLAPPQPAGALPRRAAATD